MHAIHDQPRERLFYFRRRFQPTQRMLRGVFVPAPWLDVVLLVVLFFITQSSFVVQPGVNLELPVSPASGHERYGDLVVTIPQEGMYFFNDERMTLDGLAAALARTVRDDPGRALLVEADGRIAHQSLVEVYNLAVSAGIRHVLLATRSPALP